MYLKKNPKTNPWHMADHFHWKKEIVLQENLVAFTDPIIFKMSFF